MNFSLTQSARALSAYFGVDPRVLPISLVRSPWFLSAILRYQRANKRPTLAISLKDLHPILNERKASAGTMSGHYFHQDLWAARKIFERRPARHIDIGSRIDGFVAHLLTFMPVTLIDIRPPESSVAGLTFVRDDATELRTFDDDSTPSISSLHAAEHFGLGRYSDPIDPQACFRFMQALQRVLSPGGWLYFSVPIGRERVEFNAHRVFGINTILEEFRQLQLVSFSFVGTDRRLYSDVKPEDFDDTGYACGLFEFSK